MAALPPCTLGCRVKKAVKYCENKLYKYDIGLVLLIELGSLLIRHDANYALYTFPLLMYGVVYILLRTIITKADYLKHCARKKLAYKTISYYYLFGIFSMLFHVSDNIYTTIVSNSLLVVAFILTAMSLFGKKN